jgi:hypothetical protein
MHVADLVDGWVGGKESIVINEEANETFNGKPDC